MAKKKTRVILPDGIKGLVRDLQNGTPNNDFTVEPTNESAEPKNKPAEPAYNPTEHRDESLDAERTAAQASQTNSISGETSSDAPSPSPTVRAGEGFPASDRAGEGVSPSPTVRVGEGLPGEGLPPIGGALPGRSYSPGRPPKKDTMKEYHIVKDDGKDSWQLFLDLAKQYKDGGGKLATIYIDPTLKNILDRMKYVGQEKLPTSAVLSSIVARFIYDHEDDIRKALFSGNIF